MSDSAIQRDPDRSRPVELLRDGGVAILSLANPDRRNALSATMRVELIAAFDQLFADPTCGIIILTGTGGHFCAGGDLKTAPLAEPAPHLARARAGPLHALIRSIAAGPKIVIAAVEGAAYGAGMSIAAACDIVIASEQAKFCASFARIGLMPDAGLMWSLPQRVGPALAKRLMLTGEVIGGAQAGAIGLADYVAPAGTALAAARERASSIAGLAPLSIAATKSVMARGAVSLDAVLACEAEVQPLLTLSKDYAEGRAAFRDRRTAAFVGG